MSEGAKLTHFDAKGDAAMVDVTDKAVTDRTAIARGAVEMQPESLEPVELAGTTVSRASLHNYEEVARKDIRIGDKVGDADVVDITLESLTFRHGGDTFVAPVKGAGTE